MLARLRGGVINQRRKQLLKVAKHSNNGKRGNYESALNETNNQIYETKNFQIAKKSN